MTTRSHSRNTVSTKNAFQNKKHNDFLTCLFQNWKSRPVKMSSFCLQKTPNLPTVWLLLVGGFIPKNPLSLPARIDGRKSKPSHPQKKYEKKGEIPIGTHIWILRVSQFFQCSCRFCIFGWTLLLVVRFPCIRITSLSRCHNLLVCRIYWFPACNCGKRYRKYLQKSQIAQADQFFRF